MSPFRGKLLRHDGILWNDDKVLLGRQYFVKVSPPDIIWGKCETMLHYRKKYPSWRNIEDSTWILQLLSLVPVLFFIAMDATDNSITVSRRLMRWVHIWSALVFDVYLNQIIQDDNINTFTTILRPTLTQGPYVDGSLLPTSFDRAAYATSSLKERLAPHISSYSPDSAGFFQRISSQQKLQKRTHSIPNAEDFIEVSFNQFLAAESLIKLSENIPRGKQF